MRETIILDLDDTIIETKYRQYSVIDLFFRNKGIQISSFEDFLKYRVQNNCSNFEYARKYMNDIETETHFKNFFLQNIESDIFLQKDTLILNLDFLNAISLKYNLIILSLRSNKINSIKQLKQLNIFDFFSEIFFLKHSIENPKTSKIQLLLKKFKIKSFVGDTISDFEASRLNEIEFIGVETGLFMLSGDFTIHKDINDYFKTLL